MSKRRMNPKSLANLSHFKAGPDPRRNLGGRPSRTPVTAALIELLDQPFEHDPTMTWAQAIALAIMRKAADGSATHAAEITDRVEGRAPQRIAISGFSLADAHISTKNGIRRISELSTQEMREIFDEATEVLEAAEGNKPTEHDAGRSDALTK